MVLDCDCPLDRRLYLYVGRAVMLRGRLQVHAFGSLACPASPWIQEFIDDPHCHQVFASAWYVPKNELYFAETTLIDALQPIKNKRDRGIGRPDLWPFRLPDTDGIDIESLEPDKKHTRYIARNSPVRHEPAVYAWWVDPGADLWAAHTILKRMNLYETNKNKNDVKALRNAIAVRLKTARKTKQDFLKSLTSSDL
jgi:hypothetical protein